ncbi:hypothetical protein KY084_04030 [Stakelama sp. CBK3Z-3]|uniref:Uncharacterized protein n=1 Tax=Stakelama flava TaxID=2860338 RepID=A0ABS6XIM3_9SPHN|nr:hypothetical protein [Stakelama flava]MBW4330041.1 hypothetical protein [Stakelama flava]
MTAQERLAAAPPVRAHVLELLDEISSPMNARELDSAFQGEGFTRSQARRMTLALKHLYVVALVRK